MAAGSVDHIEYGTYVARVKMAPLATTLCRVAVTTQRRRAAPAQDPGQRGACPGAWRARRRRVGPLAQRSVVMLDMRPQRLPGPGRAGADADRQVVPVVLHLVRRVVDGQLAAAREVRAQLPWPVDVQRPASAEAPVKMDVGGWPARVGAASCAATSAVSCGQPMPSAMVAAPLTLCRLAIGSRAARPARRPRCRPARGHRWPYAGRAAGALSRSTARPLRTRRPVQRAVSRRRSTPSPVSRPGCRSR